MEEEVLRFITPRCCLFYVLIDYLFFSNCNNIFRPLSAHLRFSDLPTRGHIKLSTTCEDGLKKLIYQETRKQLFVSCKKRNKEN